MHYQIKLGGSPILTILSNIPKINPSEKITIQASINVSNNFVASKAHWKAIDNKGVSINITR